MKGKSLALSCVQSTNDALHRALRYDEVVVSKDEHARTKGPPAHQRSVVEQSKPAPYVPRAEAEPAQPIALPDEEEFAVGASGAIAEAIRASRERGIPTTHIVDGQLVRVHPDGRREPLGSQPSGDEQS